MLATGQIHPFGIVLIVGFAIILVWAVIHDKKKAKQLLGEVSKMLEGKIAGSHGNFFITTDNMLVTVYGEATGSGYCIYPLKEISYIMTARDQTTRSWTLSLYDANKKIIKGQKYDSRKKKPAKAKAYYFTSGEDIELRDFIHNYVPQAKLVGIYFEDI